MIVPFVFNISVFREAVYLWYFYKYLELAKQYGWPMIAQEIYFNKPPSEFAAEKRAEAFMKPFADRMHYTLPRNIDLTKIKQYTIPDSIWQELAFQLGSITDAFCFLSRERYEPFEELLNTYIDDISLKYNEEIEAIFTLGHNPSLQAVAEKYNIPVIHFEWGVFRHPTYLDTAYFSFDNLNSTESVEKRWSRFLQENENYKFPIFTNSEILAVFLKKENLRELKKLNIEPKYKMGAALGYAVWELLQYDTRYSDAEMLYEIRSAYGDDHMVIRCHPGDPYGAIYPAYKNRIESPQYSTIDFILACENVASIGSNVSMEALYWGRKSNVKRPSPAWYAAAHSVQEEGKAADNLFLTFYAFCYLVPFELLTDLEYIRWRLTNPSEKDIFFKHLNFFLVKKGVPESISFMLEGKRLEMILEYQNK